MGVDRLRWNDGRKDGKEAKTWKFDLRYSLLESLTFLLLNDSDLQIFEVQRGKDCCVILYQRILSIKEGKS